MSELSLDFQPVTFEKERERVFRDLAVRPVLVTAWLGGERPVTCHVIEILPGAIALQIVGGDASTAKKNASVELLFSLDEGQYHLTTTLEAASGDRWDVVRGGELSRLQRRNNFRASVGFNSKIVFKISSLKTRAIKQTDLKMVDLSAGGARVVWDDSLGAISDHDSITGVVSTPGRDVEVFGVVKTVIPDPKGTKVGMEFHNVSQKDEQALLFLCLQLRRQAEPIKA